MMDNLPIEYPRSERCDDSADWTPAAIQRHFDWWLVHRATEAEPCPVCLIQKLTAENDRLKGEVVDSLKKAYDQEVTIISLKAQVEKYKDQSDYLCDRLEAVSAAAENALQRLFQVHTNSGTTFSIPPYGTAQKMADTALNDLKRALGHKI